MSYKSTAKKLETYRGQIAGLREKMRTLQAAVEPEPVEDYEFATPDGTVRLSKLFGRKDDLIVIHNMGSSCPTARCGPTASTASTTIWPTVPRSRFRAPMHRRPRSASPRAAAGASPW